MQIGDLVNECGDLFILIAVERVLVNEGVFDYTKTYYNCTALWCVNTDFAPFGLKVVKCCDFLEKDIRILSQAL